MPTRLRRLGFITAAEKKPRKEDKKGAGEPAPVHKDFDELLFLIFPKNGDNIFLFNIDKIKRLSVLIDDFDAICTTARIDMHDRSFTII